MNVSTYRNLHRCNLHECRHMNYQLGRFLFPMLCGDRCAWNRKIPRQNAKRKRDRSCSCSCIMRLPTATLYNKLYQVVLCTPTPGKARSQTRTTVSHTFSHTNGPHAHLRPERARPSSIVAELYGAPGPTTPPASLRTFCAIGQHRVHIARRPHHTAHAAHKGCR